jgi:zinc protease
MIRAVPAAAALLVLCAGCDRIPLAGARDQTGRAGVPPHPNAIAYPPLEFRPPKPERAALSNGLQVLLLPRHELPLVDVQVMVRTGYAYDPPGRAGLALLTCAAMRSGGTGAHSPEDLDAALERMGASVSVDAGLERTTARLSCRAADLEPALGLLAEVLLQPAFRADRVDIERAALRETLRRQDDRPGELMDRAFRRVMFRGHPYSNNPAGDEAGLSAIGAPDLEAFHARYFVPSRCVVGVSGDIDRARLMPLLERLFGGWRPAELPAGAPDFLDAIPPVPATSPGPGVWILRKETSQTHIRFGLPAPDRRSADYAAMLVTNFILGGGGFSARMTSRVRSDEGLAYDVGTRFEFLREGGVFQASAQTRVDATRRAMLLMRGEIARMSAEVVAVEELRDAQAALVNRFLFRFDSPAEAVAQYLDIEFYGLPADELDTFVDRLRAVTERDVQRVARERLDAGKIAVVLVGDFSRFDGAPSDFGRMQFVGGGMEKR